MTEDAVGVVDVNMCPLLCIAPTFSGLTSQEYSHGV